MRGGRARRIEPPTKLRCERQLVPRSRGQTRVMGVTALGGALRADWHDAGHITRAESRCVPLPRVASGRLGRRRLRP